MIAEPLITLVTIDTAPAALLEEANAMEGHIQDFLDPWWHEADLTRIQTSDARTPVALELSGEFSHMAQWLEENGQEHNGHIAETLADALEYTAQTQYFLRRNEPGNALYTAQQAQKKLAHAREDFQKGYAQIARIDQDVSPHRAS
jgi:hypothetical protein